MKYIFSVVVIAVGAVFVQPACAAGDKGKQLAAQKTYLLCSTGHLRAVADGNPKESAHLIAEAAASLCSDELANLISALVDPEQSDMETAAKAADSFHNQVLKSLAVRVVLHRAGKIPLLNTGSTYSDPAHR